MSTNKRAIVVPIVSAVDPVDFHVAAIVDALNRTVLAFIEVGRKLQTALDDLPHGNKADLWERLPFGQSMGAKLCAIAADPRIYSHGNNLPPHPTTLYAITRLTDEQFAIGIKQGVIHADMRRVDLQALQPESEPRSEPAWSANKCALSQYTCDHAAIDAMTEDEATRALKLKYVQYAGEAIMEMNLTLCPISDEMLDAAKQLRSAADRLIDHIEAALAAR